MANFYSSDFHFSHHNILYKKYTKERHIRYATLEEMDMSILYSINELKATDTLYFLGDFSMNFTAVEKYLPLIRPSLVWVVGNHCKVHPRARGHEQTREKCFKLNPRIKEIVTEKVVEIGPYRVLLNHFPWLIGPTPEYLKHEEWRPRRENYPGIQFLLYGHTHVPEDHRLGDRMLNVGWDAWFKMVPEEEILEIIKENV